MAPWPRSPREGKTSCQGKVSGNSRWYRLLTESALLFLLCMVTLTISALKEMANPRLAVFAKAACGRIANAGTKERFMTIPWGARWQKVLLWYADL